jgi:hypothetical protein
VRYKVQTFLDSLVGRILQVLRTHASRRSRARPRTLGLRFPRAVAGGSPRRILGHNLQLHKTKQPDVRD